MPNISSHVVIVAALIFLIPHKHEAVEILTEAQLHEDIFKNYNPKVRPVLHPTQILDVTVRMYLLRIGDLSEKNQLLTSSIWMDIRWTDVLLTWNESEYGGVQSILADKRKIWTPDLLVQNEIGNKRGIDETTLNDAIVMANGEVTWWPGKEVKTTCKVDSTKYPFDTQVCEIEISKWYNDDRALNVTYDFEKIDLSHYEHSEEWDILETYVVKHRHFEAYQNFSRIKYGMKIKRRPLYYILNIIVPLLILAALNQMCFVLPIESGEKIGMCMSIFLTFVVFLTLISDTLPQSSIHIPIFGGYLVFQLIVSGIIIFLEVIVLQTYHRRYENERKSSITNLNNIFLSKTNSNGNNQSDQIPRTSLAEEDQGHVTSEHFVVFNIKKAAALDKLFGYVVFGVNISAILSLFFIFHF